MVFINIFFYRISEHGTDRSAQILILILVVELFEFFLKDDFQRYRLAFLYFLFGIIVSLKAFYFLYLIFWLIQFFGVTQVEQSSYMFERLSYEISSNQLMMKINNKQGMPIKWESIKKVKIQSDGFLFKLNVVQFIIFPFRVFNNENEIRFLKSILNRKGYVR